MQNKLRKLEKKNLSSVAYEAIKKMIIDGQVKEGEILPESQIAKALNMSRTPVREAIRKLENEGVLKSIDGVGTLVSSITFKDILDIYEVRVALETKALKTSINNISKSELEKLKVDIEKVAEKLEINEMEAQAIKELYDLDTKLHELIIFESDNEYIKKIMTDINFKIRRNRQTAYNNYETSKASAIQHLEIVERILDKDYQAAAEAIEMHIYWSLRTVERFMHRM